MIKPNSFSKNRYIIKQNNGYSYSTAYASCEEYVKQHYPEIYESERFESNELQFVSEYNTMVSNSSEDLMYNSSLFPKTDEKYNDALLIFYCDNNGYSDYGRITELFVFVIERDIGKILEVIEKQFKLYRYD